MNDQISSLSSHRLTSTSLRSILSVLLFCLCLTLNAAPAKRIVKTVTLQSGEQVEAVLVGDEFGHGFLTADGRLLRPLDNGRYTEMDKTMMEKKWQIRSTETNDKRIQRSVSRRRVDDTDGKKKGLILLVEFSDKAMSEAGSREAFDEMFNQVCYNKNQHVGSVHDYFLDQSYGKLDLEFDILGPYKLKKELAYYGKNDMYNNDAHADEMIVEALTLADDDVNYRDYDWDGDGEVEQVFVIYAGYCEAEGANANTIWPHESWLRYSPYGHPMTLDGVTIDTYACSSEMAGSAGNRLHGIGTACHEFSHCLGLPDLYDMSTTHDCFGLNSWSLMDNGNYNGPEGFGGNVPCGYTAYERMYAGWLQPEELKSTCRIEGMQPLTTRGDAYIVYNDAYANEYYLLENRQQEKWDTYLSGHGLLIYHIDYDATVWGKNAVNSDASHQHCTIFHADRQEFSGIMYGIRPSVTPSDLAGDPYPGTSGNTALSDDSYPAATLFHRNANGSLFMGKPIEQISEKDGLIAFTFMGDGSDDTWNGWKPYGAGTCTYTYNHFYRSPEERDHTIFWRTAKADENSVQFKVRQWADGATLLIDCDLRTGYCTVNRQFTGMTDSQSGDIYAADRYTYLSAECKRQDARYEDTPSTFDPETGKFILDMTWYDLKKPAVDRGSGEDFICTKGGFKDYSVSITLGEQKKVGDALGEQPFTLTLGSDVAFCRYAVIDDHIQGSLRASAAAITEGSIESTTASQGGDFIVTEGSGKYTLIAVSYDADGKAHEWDGSLFSFSFSGDWVSLGKAAYTDDIMTSVNNLATVTYDVEVEYNVNSPGLYRMKNAYGESFPLNSKGDWSAEDIYIEIDARDPKHVTIAKQDMGVNWGSGECYIESLASYYLEKGLSVADVERKKVYGKIDNGIITFPMESINMYVGSKQYEANLRGAFRLNLTTTGIPSTSNEAEEQPYYDLLGRRLTAPTHSGIYIRNGKKILVK